MFEAFIDPGPEPDPDTVPGSGEFTVVGLLEDGVTLNKLPSFSSTSRIVGNTMTFLFVIMCLEKEGCSTSSLSSSFNTAALSDRMVSHYK